MEGEGEKEREWEREREMRDREGERRDKTERAVYELSIVGTAAHFVCTLEN